MDFSDDSDGDLFDSDNPFYKEATAYPTIDPLGAEDLQAFTKKPNQEDSEKKKVKPEDSRFNKRPEVFKEVEETFACFSK